MAETKVGWPDNEENWRTLYWLLGAGALLFVSLLILCVRLMLQLPSWAVDSSGRFIRLAQGKLRWELCVGGFLRCKPRLFHSVAPFDNGLIFRTAEGFVFGNKDVLLHDAGVEVSD